MARFGDHRRVLVLRTERLRRVATIGVALLLPAVTLVQPARADEPGWTGLGPDGGRILALAASPHGDRALYAGVTSGVFVSRDDGASWRLAGLAGERVLALAVDPTTPARVWAGVDALSGQGSGGAFRSDDGGDTWTPARQGLEDPWYPPDSPYFHYEAVESLLVDPDAGEVVWAGTSQGLFRSVDGGTTWTQVGFGRGVEALVAGAGSPPVLFAAVRDWNRLYRSNDAGATWMPLLAALGRASQATELGRVVGLATAGRDPGPVYAITGEEVFRSDDGGEEWRSLGILPTAVDSSGHATLVAAAVDPRDQRTVRVATLLDGVFTSRDGGESWQAEGGGLECSPDGRAGGHLRTSALVVAPGTGSAVLGTERHGVYLRSGGDGTWRASGRGLHALGVAAVVLDPERPWRLLAATRGLGLLASGTSGTRWRADNDGVDDDCGRPDSPWSFPTPDCRWMHDAVWPDGESDPLVAGECGLLTRSPGSPVWSLDASPGPWSDLVVAASPQELWSVRWRSDIVHSLDGGTTWEGVSDLPSPLSPTSLAVAPGGELVAAGSTRGLWLSPDSGATWEGPVAEINATCPDGEWTSVSVVAFLPGDPQRLVAGTACGVFVGAPDGSEWRRAGLDGDHVTALASGGERVFAATGDGGVFMSEDDLATWTLLPRPSGLVGVTSLTLDPAQRRLYASTLANGAFVLDLPQPSPRRGRARTSGSPPEGAERADPTP